jgi:hypothetical protein
MTTAPHSSSDRPAFIIGITGNMDPDFSEENFNKDVLRKRLRGLFSFLRGKTDDELKNGRDAVEALLSAKDESPGIGLQINGLSQWRGMGPDTPIVLLSSLAPGVDQIAAKEAKAMGIEVRCPLPYPKHIYATCSTFQSLKPGDPERLEVLVAELDFGKDEDDKIFPVYLAEDLEEGAWDNPAMSEKGLSLLEDRMRDEIRNSDHAKRQLRYRAAGEFVEHFRGQIVGSEVMSVKPTQFLFQFYIRWDVEEHGENLDFVVFCQPDFRKYFYRGLCIIRNHHQKAS